MPVRKVPKNYLGVRGRFPSVKNERSLEFESLLERDFMILNEFDDAVEKFEEQPVKVPYQVKKRNRKPYVPDLLVTYRSNPGARHKRPSLFEVKTTGDLEKNKEKYRPKFAAARAYAKERGWDFRFATESLIRRQRLKNLKFLRGYRLVDATPGEVSTVLSALMKFGRKADFDTLLDAISKSDDERLMMTPVIWHLVLIGRLEIEMDKPISSSTTIRAARKKSS